MPRRSVLAKWLQRLPRLLQSRSTVSARLLREREEDVDHLNAVLNGASIKEDGEDVESVVSRIVTGHAIELFQMLQGNETPGFSLEVKTSSLGDAAGDGLFVTGAVQPGEIVALYPGTVYFAEELAFFGGVNAIFQIHETTHFILRRADGILIDGLGKSLPLSCGGVLAPSEDGDLELLERIEELRERAPLMPTNPPPLARAYALAHKANHPPQGTPANVIPVGVDFDVAECQKLGLSEFLPTTYALEYEQPAGDNGKYLCEHTICFVASRTIAAGEEVWLDYRTSPDSRPPWFADAARPPYDI
eukprot:g1615.t1